MKKERGLILLIQESVINLKFSSFRDELCRNGDLLNSPALNYTLFDLSTAVNSLRDLKSSEEQMEGTIKEEENETIPIDDSMKV